MERFWKDPKKAIAKMKQGSALELARQGGVFKLEKQHVQRYGVFNVLKVVYCGWFMVDRVGGGEKGEERGENREVSKGRILASQHVWSLEFVL